MHSWVWPGVATTTVLTALAAWFGTAPVEHDLVSRASAALIGNNQRWATVDADGRDLSLRGTAPDEPAQVAAAQVAAAIPGVRSVSNLSVLPPVAEPFAFRAIKSSHGLTLSGDVPPGSVRADIVSVVERFMPGVRITDDLSVARGAPDGFPALVGFALAQLADMKEGEVSVSGLDYTIRGAAAGQDAYERLTAAVAGKLPGEGRLASARIVPPAN
ncbi:BON domain-containing protein [Phyllobacterium leguminum]|uniref:BON domain-containing protein n=1 Tax=Phyllobacterium leguminum TaxID=314237 RepID=A0A318T206_9HYPH|nr:BON domain-containing protein [Phyllobacterium leguminum]PYE88440.1 BON domain-containing protein [Phyllobacterium leguminum]